MDFKDLVQNRRSIRSFSPEPLTEAELKALLRAALMAPTGRNSRSWHFHVVTDPATLQRLANCRDHGSQFLAEATAAVIVLGNPAATDIWVEDTSIAAVTLQYQAADMGLASCWCHVRGREGVEEAVRQMVSLPEGLSVECIIGLGRPAATRPPHDEEALLWDHVTYHPCRG